VDVAVVVAPVVEGTLTTIGDPPDECEMEEGLDGMKERDARLEPGIPVAEG